MSQNLPQSSVLTTDMLSPLTYYLHRVETMISICLEYDQIICDHPIPSTKLTKNLHEIIPFAIDW